MSEFDPNVEPETDEQYDAYVEWCAHNFMLLSEGIKRTFREALRCAHWLLVVAVYQMTLAEDSQDADALRHQIDRYQALARALERQVERFPVEQLIVLRSSLDCWEPVGQWASNVLAAAKCAVSALILIDVHPLVDLWDLEACDVWAMLEAGRDNLAAIEVWKGDGVLVDLADFAVRKDDLVTAKFTWQRANNIARHVGMQKLSGN